MSLALRLLFFATTLISWVTVSAQGGAQPTATTKDITTAIETGAVLSGQWRRPDGGYVIQIKAIHPEGQLEAAYFNPRSIRVDTAQWQFGGGTLQLRIRLNDTGYEGAFYLLQYNPATNQLVGEYHPAGQGTFYVAFERLLTPPQD
jgi:hypothetical protein